MIIAFEGIHGCGKTTQLIKLFEWSKKNLQCQEIIKTEWNSFPGLQDLNWKLKADNLLTPVVSSLLHSLDFALRYDHFMSPCLRHDGIVLSDRYYYTGYVRDSLRGVSSTLINEMYKRYPKPDLLFYFAIKPEDALKRMKNLDMRSDYITGIDIGYSEDRMENFLMYLIKQEESYQELINAYDLNVCVIDSYLDQSMQFELILKALLELEAWRLIIQD